jgi:hypothetical protein
VGLSIRVTPAPSTPTASTAEAQTCATDTGAPRDCRATCAQTRTDRPKQVYDESIPESTVWSAPRGYGRDSYCPGRPDVIRTGVTDRTITISPTPPELRPRMVPDRLGRTLLKGF